MGFWGWWILLGAVVVIVFIAKAVQSIRYPKATQSKGIEPGQGDQLIDAPGGGLSTGGGHSSVTQVTRDPQEYAKGMMPGGKK